MGTVVRIWYEGKDIGSRQKPIQIISSGQYGTVILLEVMNTKRFIYRLILQMEDDDPEELLQELRLNGAVSVLKMTADQHTIFLSKRWRNYMSKKK